MTRGGGWESERITMTDDDIVMCWATSWRSRGLPARLVQEWHGEVSGAAATVLRQWRIHYWLGIQGMVAGTLKKWRTINGGRVVVVVGRCWYNNPLQWASFVLYNTSTPWVVQSLLLLQPSCDRQTQSDWLTDWQIGNYIILIIIMIFPHLL